MKLPNVVEFTVFDNSNDPAYRKMLINTDFVARVIAFDENTYTPIVFANGERLTVEGSYSTVVSKLFPEFIG